MKAQWGAICGLVLALLLSGCEGSAAPTASSSTSASAKAPQLVTLKVSQTAEGTSSWPLHVGVAQGFFRDAGLDVQTLSIASSATQTQALLNGDVNFNIYTIDSVAKAVAPAPT